MTLISKSKAAFFLLLCCVQIWLIFDNPLFAQKTEKYQSPVRHKTKLSGSFGELRPNHFHTGIDIKAKNGVQGDSIFAVKSGYISRIRNQWGSYGKSIYLNHNDGITTVYAHLMHFRSDLDDKMLKIQKEYQASEIDFYPKSDTIFIKQGEYLGKMGNTGRSYGPHLHFECRDTKTELPIDPLAFGLGVSDNKAPFIKGIKLYEFDENFNLIQKSNLDLEASTINLKNRYYGIGVQAFDQMDYATNYNGIYKIELLQVDDPIFVATFDTLSFYEMKYINAQIDFEEKISTNSSYFKCFKTPNNKVRNIKTQNQGLFQVKDQSKITIRLSDFAGNTTSHEIKIVGNKKKLLSELKIKHEFFETVDTSVYLEDTIFFPNKILYTFMNINSSIQKKNGWIKIIVGNETTPIHSYFKIVISDFGAFNNQDRSKLILLHVSEKGIITHLGGKTNGSQFTAFANRLGSFYIKSDEKKPSVYKTKESTESFRYMVKDQFPHSGQSKGIYITVLDENDNWIPFDFKSITNTLTLLKKNIPKEASKIIIKAKDHSQNERVYSHLL